MKKLVHGLTIAAAFAPLFVFAQGLGNLKTLLTAIGDLVKAATPIVIGLALLVFFWGLIKYIFSSGDEEGRKAARGYMIGGVIALFVMVSIFGLIKFIGSAVGVGQDTSIPIPGVL